MIALERTAKSSDLPLIARAIENVKTSRGKAALEVIAEKIAPK
jgi:hypothetical protein